MKILADTSVWIAYLCGDDRYLPLVKEKLEQGIIVGSELVMGELLQGARNQKEREVIQEYWAHLPKLDEAGIFIQGGVLANKENLFGKGVGLIDAALLAFMRRHGLQLWTLDTNLGALLHRNEKFEPKEPRQL